MSPREQGQPNGLLNALSATDFALLQPNLKSVPLHFRQQMQRANCRIQTVYFIESGLGSVVAIGGGERRQAEVAVVGCEGMTGIPVVLGTERSPCDVFMQVEGSGQSIEADQLTKAMEQSLTMTRCFTRFAHVFAVQGYYTALANAQGTIEERLARWLLMAQDRIGGDVLTLTHEFLALMLGVRRAGVSTALQHFEAQALIRTSRGAVKVTDRGGLHQSANGFYGHPEAELERLFPSSGLAFSGRRSLQEGAYASRNTVI